MGKRIHLHCTAGNSDKVYMIQLEERPNGMGVVNFQYGRRGSTLKDDTKTPTPVPFSRAEAIYADLVHEKRYKKQYDLISEEDTSPRAMVIQETSVDIKSGAVTRKTTTQMMAPVNNPDAAKGKGGPILLPQLLNAIDDHEVQRYIDDDAFMAQEKKDGHRRLIISVASAMGLNKKGEAVTLGTNIQSALPKGTPLATDGEIIGDKYYAFDLLMHNERSLREMDAIRRYELLKKVKFGKDIIIVDTALTKEEKQKMFDELKAGNREGIVFKRKTAAYKAGRPNSYGDQLKYKFQKTASFIVDNLTGNKRSVGLVLLDGENRVPMGKCTIPPNHEIPCIGEVVEVQYLYAYKGGSIFQPVYLGKRVDVEANECIIEQLIFKREEEEV